MGLINFTMAKMSKFIQNIMKPEMNQDAFWCNERTLKTRIKIMIIPYDHYAHNVYKYHNVQHNSLLAKKIQMHDFLCYLT